MWKTPFDIYFCRQSKTEKERLLPVKASEGAEVVTGSTEDGSGVRDGDDVAVAPAPEGIPDEIVAPGRAPLLPPPLDDADFPLVPAALAARCAS